MKWIKIAGINRLPLCCLCLVIFAFLFWERGADARTESLHFSHTYDVLGLGMEVQVLSNGLLGDWYPFKKSAGLKKVWAPLVVKSGKNEDATDIIPYPPYLKVQLGALKTTIDFNDAWPFAGIGWGNVLGENKQWDVVLGVGVVFQGPPELELDKDRFLPSTSASHSNMSQTRRWGQNLPEKFNYYPMISIGVTYQF